MEKVIELTVNGNPRTVTSLPTRSLLEVLREDFGLTGTKYGCGEGQCGACTVLIDGQAEHACQLSIEDVEGQSVITIEGLADAANLHPMQQAFLDARALQCGFCTPGMILGAISLLKQRPNPTEAEILSGMEGHICRCGGYVRIVKAVQTAARTEGAHQ